MTTWTLDYPPYKRWTPQLLADVIRLTEDGRIRITEQSPVRIIFRFSQTWNQAWPSFTPWTKE